MGSNRHTTNIIKQIILAFKKTCFEDEDLTIIIAGPFNKYKDNENSLSCPLKKVTIDVLFWCVCVYRDASTVVNAVQGSGSRAHVSSALVAGVPPHFM